MNRYQLINACTEPLPVICRLLAVSSTCYYQWRQRPAQPADQPARAHSSHQVWVGDITYLPLVGGRW